VYQLQDGFPTNEIAAVCGGYNDSRQRLPRTRLRHRPLPGGESGEVCRWHGEQTVLSVVCWDMQQLFFLWCFCTQIDCTMCGSSIHTAAVVYVVCWLDTCIECTFCGVLIHKASVLSVLYWYTVWYSCTAHNARCRQRWLCDIVL